MINWHRLFGLNLMDLFANSDYQVELEKSISFQEQYLDMVIIQKSGSEGKKPEQLPDGLETLAEYNLITYKSLKEPLERWTLDELVGLCLVSNIIIGTTPKIVV